MSPFLLGSFVVILKYLSSLFLFSHWILPPSLLWLIEWGLVWLVSPTHPLFRVTSSWETQRICRQNNRGISPSPNSRPFQQTISKPWVWRCHFITCWPPPAGNQAYDPPFKVTFKDNHYTVHMETTNMQTDQKCLALWLWANKLWKS